MLYSPALTPVGEAAPAVLAARERVKARRVDSRIRRDMAARLRLKVLSLRVPYHSIMRAHVIETLMANQYTQRLEILQEIEAALNAR